MMYGIKFVLKYALGLDIAGRNFAVFPDDTFVVSYPRSGNTWTRFLIANLVYPNQNVTFENIERLIPDTSSQSSRSLKRTRRPRIIKSHEYFDHRYGKVIYIVRDPRDVALSYYDFQRKYVQINDKYPLENYVDDFVSGRLISKGWGTWGQNVASWLSTRGQSSSFLLLHYEDMISDTRRDLARIAEFMGIEPASSLLDNAIAASTADRMRDLEKTQSNNWVATKNRRKDIPFVGPAKSGGWKTQLPERSIAQIENAWGDLMTTLGYE
ncbi:MAG TPA: sulfotransferase domain-containing protein, partial [Terriglobales bacterium]|nr:sulfotransferase domain-containing protein [Terriglobales bacterium]